jgi:hypothetical protein
MKATKLLLLAVALLCSCLLCPASAQDVEASTWGAKPGKPNRPPKNCPAEQPFDPKTFNWGSIYTAYPGNWRLDVPTGPAADWWQRYW